MPAPKLFSRRNTRTVGILLALLAPLFLFTNAKHINSYALIALDQQHGNAYAPEVFVHNGQKRMLIGGWRNHADTYKLVNGKWELLPDKIFLSRWSSGRWTAPKPILWTNSGSKYSVPGSIEGLQINDPTIVKANNGNWLNMYYTIYPFRPYNPAPYTAHKIGFATSIDGGVTWTDHGVVHAPSHGAWAPAAINVGGKTWVYYHTGEAAPKARRQIFNANGWQKEGGAALIRAPVVPLNIDIHKLGNKYVIVANGKKLTQVVRYISNNGINFWKDKRDKDVIIDGGDNYILTPHVEVTKDRGYRWDSEYMVYFGFDHMSGDVPLHSNSIQAWKFRNSK